MPPDLGLYIHVPFCRGKCPYCDFYSRPQREIPTDYIDLLKAEWELLAQAHGLDHSAGFRTIYLGGGTPSLLSLGAVERLLAYFRVGPLAYDVSLEANPDSLTPDYLRGLHDLGIDRLSLGVQSLNPADLRFLGRRHTATEARQSVENAVQAGFTNISVDLIYGLPTQSVADITQSLVWLVSQGISHISAYHLTYELRTVFGRRLRQGHQHEVSEETSQAHFDRVHEFLTDKGFDHYEVSSFARNGAISQHNASYWQGIPYVGLGPSAHSYLSPRRWWNVSDYDRWRAGILACELPREVEVLGPEAEFNEWILTGLRTRWGLDLSVGQRRFGPERMDMVRRGAQSWIRTGVAQLDGTMLHIPPARFLLADAVIRDLML